MAREDDLEIIKSAFKFHLALVANPQLTDESWKASKKTAIELFNDVINVIHPWAAKSTTERKQEEFDKLHSLYKTMIGDLADPEFKAAVDAEEARLRSEVVKPAESVEARIIRLSTEQWRRQKELKKR